MQQSESDNKSAALKMTKERTFGIETDPKERK